MKPREVCRWRNIKTFYFKQSEDENHLLKVVFWYPYVAYILYMHICMFMHTHMSEHAHMHRLGGRESGLEGESEGGREGDSV